MEIKKTLPTTQVDEPITAYKKACIVADDLKKLKFRGIIGLLYDSVDISNCDKGEQICLNNETVYAFRSDYHHCGFHAYNTFEDLENSMYINRKRSFKQTTAYVGLKVELSGTVIKHERGYRASQQQVKEIYFQPNNYCQFAGGGKTYEPYCYNLAEGYQRTWTNKYAMLVPKCLEHCNKTDHMYTITEISKRIDIPIVEKFLISPNRLTPIVLKHLTNQMIAKLGT